jgi:hypothetical protein
VTPSEPSLLKFDIEEAPRYFEVFRSSTSFEILSLSPDTESLRLILLQAGASNYSIRHAIAALGALKMAAETAFPSIQSGTCGVSNRHHRTALRLYSCAIAEMNNAVSRGDQDLRTTLLTCLMILCFEAWNGNQALAIQQMQIGVRLIQEGKTGANHSPRGSPSKSEVEDELVRTFDRLAVQVTTYTPSSTHSPISMDAPACYKYLNREGLEVLTKMPSKFNSLKEAGFYQNTLMHDGLSLLQNSLAQQLQAVGRDKQSNVTGGRAFAEVDLHIAQFKQWNAALQDLWKTLCTQGGSNMCCAAVLKIHLNLNFLSLLGLMAGNEMVYDDYDKTFIEIIDLAEIVLRSEAESKGASFTCDMGIVISLQVTARLCRHSAIRRKAIRLLLQSARREGVWDSLFVGKMMEWVVDMEEEYMENGRIPEWARIGGVARTEDLQRRTATLMCQQRKSKGSDELVTRKTTISW